MRRRRSIACTRSGRSAARAVPALRPGADLRRRRSRLQRLHRARRADCVPIYNALDPRTHHPVAAPRRASQAICVSRQPPARSRSAHREFFFEPPNACPGSGSCSAATAGRISRCRPTSTASAMSRPAITMRFNCSPRAVLNVNRESMARYGHSPATRVFEAAGAGACLITDAFDGVEHSSSRTARCSSRDDGEDVAPISPRSPRRAGKDDWRGRPPPRPAPSTLTPPRATLEHCSTWAPAWRPRMTDPCASSFIGLSITSSWGNGHATTYRSLLAALARRGHWSASSSATCPGTPGTATCATAGRPGGPLRFTRRSGTAFVPLVRTADAVIVGSYVPEGNAVGAWVRATPRASVPSTTSTRRSRSARSRRAAASTCVGTSSPATTSTVVHRRPALDASSPRRAARPAALLRRRLRRTRRHRAERGIWATWARMPSIGSRRWRRCCSTCPANGRRALRRRRAAVPAGADWPANVDRMEHVAPHGTAGSTAGSAGR